MGQQGLVWTKIAKDRDKLEDSGGGLLPAVEGHILEKKRREEIEYNRTEQNLRY